MPHCLSSQWWSLIPVEQLLYSRLLMCKRIGAQLAAEGSSSHPANPGATESGIQTMPDGTSVPSDYFYGHLLESCEKLFDNVIDQATFEDTVRFMFGMKAYNLFTLDKVIGALIKQVRLVWYRVSCLAYIDARRSNSFCLTVRTRNWCNCFNASAKIHRLLYKIKLIIAEKRRVWLVQRNICTALIMFV